MVVVPFFIFCVSAQAQTKKIISLQVQCLALNSVRLFWKKYIKKIQVVSEL